MTGWQVDREPTLDEIMQDEVMAQVVRSAGFEPTAFAAYIADVAMRIGPFRGRANLEHSLHRSAA